LTVVFHPLAERELIESAKFYEMRATGLGADFIRQVELTVAGVAANPGAGNVLTGTIRRRLVRRFPFALLYQSEARQITVIALMHLRRRPGYWRRRLKAVS
jgi:toxin ParE1/3/4